MLYVGSTAIGFVFGFIVSFISSFLYLRIHHREKKPKVTVRCDTFVPETEPYYERKRSVDGRNARDDFTVK